MLFVGITLISFTFQHDPSMAIASVPGPVAPQFGRFPGPGFQPALASTSAFCLGGGAALHPSTAFPGDAYGVSGVSERPKKVITPLNWRTLNMLMIILECTPTYELPMHTYLL